MRTYTLEVNGTPELAFRAKDDAAAEAWQQSATGLGWISGRELSGALTVRPATRPEQAAWRKQSVDLQVFVERANEDPNHDTGDPDGLVADLLDWDGPVSSGGVLK
jgi:hypothetical protein